MRKVHKMTMIAGLLMLPTQVAASSGFFEAPGRFGSVGQAQNLCFNELRNNPFAALQAIPCFARGNDI
jgi:hypothetical protein